MAAHGRHVKGAGIIVDPSRIGTLDQFMSRERPAASGPRRVRTTWECINCGNALASTRGISRCPRCGSLEVVRLTELEPLRQAPVKLKETLNDFDPDPDLAD